MEKRSKDKNLAQDVETGQYFGYLVTHHGYRPPHEIPSPTYSLTALHVNYNVFMRA